MTPFRRTALYVLAAAAALYIVTTIGGVVFMLSQQNQHAKTILHEHTGAVVWLYARILVGYLGAGLLVALLLHPFVQGGKAAFAALGLALLGFVHTLTDETHLLYGPVQTMFCTVHDAIPAWLRNLYEPWMLEIAFGVLVLWSLHRWTRRVSPRIKAGAIAVILVVIGWHFLPESRAEGKRPTCFVYIVTDSLRADHLSCNGYERKTSPHIDALAARGTNFANCLVPTASTHESWVSLLSSTEPRVNGLRHMFPSRAQVERIQKEQTWFPEVLREHGYRTAAIGGWCGTTFGMFDFGCDHVDVSNTQNHVALIAEAAFTNHLLAAAFLDNPVGRLVLPELNRTSFTRGASAITHKARDYLAAAAHDDKPFALFVIYHVTHLPYSASYPYYQKFTDPDYRGRNRYRINFNIDEMIQRGFDHDLTDEEQRHIIDLYDGCVNEFDDQVGKIVATLDELGLADNTIVGVWGDHGDDLYEHGTTLGHGVTLFGGDHANHPPAIFAGPGVPKRRVEKLVRSYDLTPTMLGWLGFDAPKSWEGVDLRGEVPDLWALLETSYLLYRQPVPDLKPGEVVKDFPKFDHATFFDPNFDYNLVLREDLNDRLIETKCFAVREGKWKLIHVPGENGPIRRLFDLEADPHCEHDVKDAHPDVYERLAAKLPPEAR